MTDKNNKGSQNGSQIEKRVGPPVEKKNFWDRKEELENLIELLDEGANVLITAPAAHRQDQPGKRND